MTLIAFALIIALTLLGLFVIANSANMGATPAEPHSVDFSLLTDPTFVGHLDNNLKINAIKHYREQTGAGLKDAKEAVEYIMANRDEVERLAKSKRRLVDNLPVGAGVRDKIEDGDIDGAIEAYRSFMALMSSRLAMRSRQCRRR
ncbi:MAG: ribosomal protein L7/L12 [Chloroflexota bacterium]